MTLLVDIQSDGTSPLDLAADVHESLMADAFAVVSVVPWAAPVTAPETAATQLALPGTLISPATNGR